MEVTKQQLQKGLDKLFPDNFDSIDGLLYGDIDLEVYHNDGLDFHITDKGVNFEPRQLKYVEKLANLDDQEHMDLYDKHKKFHDGGDDFDYGGTYVSALVDIIKDVLGWK